MMAQDLPARQRTVVLTGLALITGLSWAYMWSMARDPMALCMANMHPWGAADLCAMFVMWAVMMVAMMVPSATPMILTFAGVNHRRRQQSLPYASTSAFVAGYLIAWTGFSAVVTVAQEALHSAALLSSMMVSTSAVFGGVLLLAAGVFQWTPLKLACLRHCRSPIGFICAGWREGGWGALRMGLHHGLHCVGCCWMLMALLFVAGVMNLWWMSALAAFVLLEKMMPAGPVVARSSGVLLMLWGVWMLGRYFEVL